MIGLESRLTGLPDARGVRARHAHGQVAGSRQEVRGRFGAETAASKKQRSAAFSAV